MSKEIIEVEKTGENIEADPKDKEIAELKSKVDRLTAINNSLIAVLSNTSIDLLTIARNASQEAATVSK